MTSANTIVMNALCAANAGGGRAEYRVHVAKIINDFERYVGSNLNLLDSRVARGDFAEYAKGAKSKTDDVMRAYAQFRAALSKAVSE